MKLRSSFSFWTLGVVLFNTGLISIWEDNNCYHSLSNWQEGNYFQSKWKLRPFCCYTKTANHCRVRWCFISVITYYLLLIWTINRNKLAWKCTRDLGERVSAGGHHATRIRPRSLEPSSLGAAGGWKAGKLSLWRELIWRSVVLGLLLLVYSRRQAGRWGGIPRTHVRSGG